MWLDIEIDKDLLGFSVHANLIKDIVSNVKNLPITIGLYRDWGSGKSCVLKILEKELEEDNTHSTIKCNFLNCFLIEQIFSFFSLVSPKIC